MRSSHMIGATHRGADGWGAYRRHRGAVRYGTGPVLWRLIGKDGLGPKVEDWVRPRDVHSADEAVQLAGARWRQLVTFWEDEARARPGIDRELRAWVRAHGGKDQVVPTFKDRDAFELALSGIEL